MRAGRAQNPGDVATSSARGKAPRIGGGGLDIRNKLNAKNADKLVFIHSNLRLYQDSQRAIRKGHISSGI